MKKIFSKMKTNSGFSLSELLVATLILLMVTSVVAAGIPVARDAYIKVTVSANAQTVLSTAVMELHSRLGVADYVEVKDNKVYYQSSTDGGRTCIYSDDTEGLMIQFYMKYGVDEGQDPVKLVSGKASYENLYVTYDTVEYDSNSSDLVFSNIVVHSDLNDNQAVLKNLIIHVLSVNPA